MQNLETGAFHEAHFQQPAFQFAMPDLAGAVMAFRLDALDQATGTLSKIAQPHKRLWSCELVAICACIELQAPPQGIPAPAGNKPQFAENNDGLDRQWA
jgi:hypothetical protein